MDEGRRKRGDGGRTMGDGRWMMDEQRTNRIRTVRDLKVYRKTSDSAMEKKADSFCPPSS
jgi:hypothetical protein